MKTVVIFLLFTLLPLSSCAESKYKRDSSNQPASFTNKTLMFSNYGIAITIPSNLNSTSRDDGSIEISLQGSSSSYIIKEATTEYTGFKIFQERPNTYLVYSISKTGSYNMSLRIKTLVGLVDVEITKDKPVEQKDVKQVIEEYIQLANSITIL